MESYTVFPHRGGDGSGVQLCIKFGWMVKSLVARYRLNQRWEFYWKLHFICRGHIPEERTAGLDETGIIRSRAAQFPNLSLPFCPPLFAPHILSFLLLSVLSFMFLWVPGICSGTNSQLEREAWSPVSPAQLTEIFCGPETADRSEARSDWLSPGQVFMLGPVGNRGW